MAKKIVLQVDLQGSLEFRDAKQAFECEYVATLLERTGGNVTEAAKLSGKERRDFYDLMRRNDVDPGDYRE